MRLAMALLAVLLLLPVGVAAQDESPALDSPVDVAVLEALCEANAPDDAAKVNCLAVVHDILAPEQGPADDIDIAALGEAYLLAVEELNAKFFDPSGRNRREGFRAWAKAADEFVAVVEMLEFPPATQVVADRLIEADSEMARLYRELAPMKKKEPDYYKLQARLAIAEDSAVAASWEIRCQLGLPPGPGSDDPCP